MVHCSHCQVRMQTFFWNSLLIGLEKTPFSSRDYMQVPMPVLFCFSKETIFGTILAIAVITWLNLRQLIVFSAYHLHKSNKIGK